MNHYDQNKPQATTAPVEGYPQGPYVAPPPAGHMMRNGEANPQNCCAALFCCCLVDAVVDMCECCAAVCSLLLSC
ncbi:protein CYSTEINE-RICH TRANSMEMBRANE MODULE 8-like isoform X2 [Cornus florida]|uniref:protein CYSTEINE-RICH TRANSMEMBRANE MODULE 8-like isoform X2 n=1 Tax=Cornus florida TaxID=4283 RepID=UPI002896E1CD|nr:protein CYSTEINE-RICH TRANSMEMBRANE MODULE 8-like isoform X2 [Cornus florida]